MHYRLVYRAPMMVMGIALKTPNEQEIADHWETFFSENVLEEIPNKCSPDIMSLYSDYKGTRIDDCTLILGCHINHLEYIPEGMVVKEIPASYYACFTAVGEYPGCLMEQWEDIWQSDLPRSYTGDFEVYGKRFEAGEVEIYVSLKSAEMAKWSEGSSKEGSRSFSPSSLKDRELASISGE